MALQLGENACAEYKDAGHPLVTAFFEMLRDAPREKIRNHVRTLLEAAANAEDAEMVVDTFVLAFQTRDARGPGKGERRLWCWLMVELATHGYKETVLRALELAPHYGYWKDLFNLLQIVAADIPQHGAPAERLYEELRSRVVELRGRGRGAKLAH